MELPESVSVHSTALVESTDIGQRTRIWAFVHVHKNVHIGDDCNICDYVAIQPNVHVGSRVTLKERASIGEGVVIDDEAFIGPGVIMPNDTSPRSPRMLGVSEVQDRYANTENWLKKTTVKRGASIGTATVISPGITIGQFAMVIAGSLVTKDVEPYRMVAGMPARSIGWACVCGERLNSSENGYWKCDACSRNYSHSKSLGLTQA